MANILFIDDDPSMRATASYALSRKGHLVFAAQNGKEAALKFGKTRPDLIVTDYSLPHREEIEGLIHENPNIPVIVISGDLKRCESSPCLVSAVKLAKPFSLLRLMDTVSYLLPAPVAVPAQTPP